MEKNNLSNQKNNPKHFKNRLQTLISLSFVLLMGIVIASTTYVLQGIAKPLLVKENNRLVEQLANKIVSDLEQQISMTEALTTALANLGETLEHDVPTYMKLIPEIMNLEGLETIIAGGGIWPEPYMFDPEIERRSFFWGRKPDGILTYYDGYNNPEGKGYHNEEWYVPAKYLASNKSFWSKSYMDPYSYQPMVTCTVPMKSNNKLLGVTTIDLKLEGLRELFNEASSVIGGYIFAVDRNNKFLSYPNEKLTKIKIQEEGTKVRQEFIYAQDLAEKCPLFIPLNNTLEKINDRIIQEASKSPNRRTNLMETISDESYQINEEEAELISAILVDPFQSEKTASNILESFHIEDDLILHEPVRVFIFHIPKTYWKIVFVTPHKKTVEVANRITLKVLLYLITTLSLLLLMAFLLLRHNLLMPLRQITSRLKQIGKGDSNLDLTLDVFSKDELGELAYFFNRRTYALRDAYDSLQKAHDELEQRVDERTKDLQEAKETADAANQAKSIFLASMSHELRTPLNAILGFSQLMTNSEKLDAKQKETLAIISRSGEHLLRLINDVLAMSKIEAGRTTLNEQKFDLYQLMDDLHVMFGLKAQEKDLQLRFKFAPDVPRFVLADEIKLRQVLINLLNNALKFTRKGFVSTSLASERLNGTIMDSKSTDNGELRIHFDVEDTGPGIAQEDFENIFEAFVQPQSEQEGQEGTGLGLPISRRFIGLMGGEIAVKSEKGKGSLFSFYIRVKVVDKVDIPNIQPDRQTVSLAPNQPSYRILVADDNWDNRQLLIKMLSPFKFELREAVNGQQTVEKWNTWKPHLIFMDIQMPIMGGLEATRRIKASDKGQETIIIAITASVFEEERDRVLSAGCDDFLRKPYFKTDIVLMMEKHLGIRFIYKDLNNGTHPKLDQDVMSPTNIAKLPTDLMQNLGNAAVRAEMDRIFDLIDEIRKHNNELAEGFENLAKDFAYDKIVELAQKAGDLK